MSDARIEVSTRRGGGPAVTLSGRWTLAAIGRRN